MRWVTTPSGTAHAIDEEATGWARTDKYGALHFLCNYYSNEAWVKTDNGKHCKKCESRAV